MSLNAITLHSRPVAVGIFSLLISIPVSAQDVQPGIDLATTPGTGVTFTDVQIPADFFGPGSDPVTGPIPLEGVPLPSLGGPDIFPTDTVVQRLETATLPGPGSQDTVPIEIVALHLQSIQPITITYNGGQNPELWDVEVCLSDSPQPLGTMDIRRDYPAGGTFDAVLPVETKYVFTRQNDTAVMTVDPGPPMSNTISQARWVDAPDPLMLLVCPLGGGEVITDGNCDGLPDPPLTYTCSNFAPGVWSRADECGIPGQPQVKRMTFGFDEFGPHGTIIAQAPSPDGDGDGISDDADNCQSEPNPLQGDEDNDSVGNVCDNNPLFNPCQEGASDISFADGFENRPVPDLSTSTKAEDDVDKIVAPGQIVTYTITLINSGSGGATGVNINDVIDANTENLTNFTFTNCGSSFTNLSSSSTVDINNLDVAVGTNCVVTYDVVVKSSLNKGTIIDNQVTIGVATEGGVGATPSSSQLIVDSSPDLSTSTKAEDDVDNIGTPGQTVTYTVPSQRHSD